MCLTDEQLETWERAEYFDVEGSNGGKYRITNRFVDHNILDLNTRQKYDEGLSHWYKPSDYENLYSYKRYCILPVDKGRTFPRGDVLLAQKFVIENDEEEFLNTAFDDWGIIDEEKIFT